MGSGVHGLVDSSNEREKKNTRVSYVQRSIGQRAAMSLHNPGIGAGQGHVHRAAKTSTTQKEAELIAAHRF